MAEAIITRASGEVEDPLPISPTSHTIGVTLKDPDGKLMVNWPVTCKDGTLTYSYTTNAKGQTIFMCNSGAANIFVNNYNGSAQILDMDASWTNIDAPVGLSTKVNINLKSDTSFHDFPSNKIFEFWKDRTIDNLILVGGGGGGGVWWKGRNYYLGGCGGGSGYMSQYNNIKFNKGIYNFVSGKGGEGGVCDSKSQPGNAGGTSYIVNTSYSANGGMGGAGEASNYNMGIGGLGNGSKNCYSNGDRSPVDFAGGGGAGGKYFDSANAPTNASYDCGGNGGYPYGGGSPFTYLTQSTHGSPGKRGGGGGGGRVYGSAGYSRGGDGGSGLMRINIHY